MIMEWRLYYRLHIRTVRIYYGTKVRMWFWHRRSVGDPVLENSHNLINAFWYSHMACQSHHCWSEQPEGHQHSFTEVPATFMSYKYGFFVSEGTI
jgi:hypothetical protein